MGSEDIYIIIIIAIFVAFRIFILYLRIDTKTEKKNKYFCIIDLSVIEDESARGTGAEPYILYKVSNFSEQTINMEEIGLNVNWEDDFRLPGSSLVPPLPCKLSPGDRAHARVDAVKFAEELLSCECPGTVEVRGYLEKTGSTIVQSVSLCFDVEKWAKGGVDDYWRSPIEIKGDLKIWTFIQDKDDRIDIDYEPAVSFNIENISRSPIAIKDVGIETGEEMNIFFSDLVKDLELPHTIEPGETCSFSMNAVRIAANLLDEGLSGKVKIAWFVEDDDGYVYRERRSKFNIDEWTSVIS
jgi:hypothetical protein